MARCTAVLWMLHLPMHPLATQVRSGRYGGLYAAQGHRPRAWGPRGTSPGAYGELTAPFLHICLLYQTKQYKTTEVAPASCDGRVSPVDWMLRSPYPQPEISRPRPLQTASGRHNQPVFKRAGVYNKLLHN